MSMPLTINELLNQLQVQIELLCININISNIMINCMCYPVIPKTQNSGMF